MPFFFPLPLARELSKYFPQKSHPFPNVKLTLNWAEISERAKSLFLQYVFEKTTGFISPAQEEIVNFIVQLIRARKCRFQTLSWVPAKLPGKGKWSCCFLGYLMCIINAFDFGLWRRTLMFRTLQSKKKNLPQNFARSLSILVLWLTDSNLPRLDALYLNTRLPFKCYL